MIIGRVMNIGYLHSRCAIILYLVILKIAFHLFLPEYGYFRDELYYICIGDQFSLTNLDTLPLSPLYLRLFTFILGYSLKTVHLASASAGAGAMVLSCLITKELKGGKYAILLTVLFFGLSIVVSLLLAGRFNEFRTCRIWIGGIIAFVFLIPFIIWQNKNDWYFIDFASNYPGGISYAASFPEYVWNQFLPNNPFTFPVWMAGLYLLLFNGRWKEFRFISIMYIFLFLLYFLIKGKYYFLIPMYAVLMPVGAIQMEENLKKVKSRIVVPLLFVLLSLPIVPLMVPVLPVNRLVDYVKVFNTNAGVKYENLELCSLTASFRRAFRLGGTCFGDSRCIPCGGQNA